MLAVALAGVAAAGFAILFRGALDWVITHLLGGDDVLEAFRALPIWARLLLPPAGAACAGAIAVLGDRAFGSQGVGHVLDAVSVGGRVSLRAAFTRGLASFFAVASGGSIGREGPIIQVGAALSAAIGRALGVGERRTSALLVAGTAAGFAAAYNTPLAATLFALEVLAHALAIELVWPAAIAVAIATLLVRGASGPGPIYGLRTFALDSPLAVLAASLLGVLGGALGAGFVHLLERAEHLFARVPSRIARAALGGLVAGVVATFVPEVAGNGYEVVREALDGRVIIATLALWLIAKAVATSGSVGGGSPGGVFTPTMFVGAAVGGAVGRAWQALGLEGATEPAGAFALVGMAAVVAGTTHAPIMAAALAFELSGDYGMVVPLLLSCVLATVVGRRIGGPSIYQREIARARARRTGE